MMKNQTIITFVLAIFICSFAQAKVVYVNKNAPGSTYDGASWATAYTTVQAGVNAAVSGDEVWVAKSAPATEAYVENVTMKENVALYGGFAGAETDRYHRDWTTNVTTIASPSTSSDTVTANSQGVILNGITIRNGRYGVYVSGMATVPNCTISGNWEGVYVKGGNAMLSNCTINGNGDNGIYLDYGGAATLLNNTISGNGWHGVSVGSGVVTVINCTISGNSNHGVYVGSSGTTVTNSIVAFNSRGIYRYDTSVSVTLSHNDVFGNTTANYDGITDPTGTNGNISVDPLLSNPYRDIHIQPGSPCRDAGNDALVQSGWTDIDGQARIQGAHVDIGSDESDGSTWTVPVTTRFVKLTGDDGNDGLSWATAKKSITSALAVSQGLDEVWVSAGTYTENVSIPTGVALYGGFAGTETERNQRNWTANVTAIASPSSSSHVVTSRSVGVTLDGFTIRNGRYGVYVNYGTATLSNCTISGNSSSGLYVYFDAATVSNCTISGNSSNGVFVDYGTAIISNCTISGNGTYGVYVGSSGTKVTNSIVAFSGTGIRRGSASYTLTLSYNDVYGNTTANYSNITDPTGTNGNISVDPLLSNPYRDIHIQPGSSCRDAGNDALVQEGWTDIDGQARIQGAHVDIGSDESDGTTWMVPVYTRFVKPTGDDGNDGLSWATAKKSIKSALAVSQGPDEVWVAAGVYTENVSIPLGVALYGGFAGTETERNQRNWSANVTAIASSSTASDVVTARSVGVTLDGFTIRNGHYGVFVYYGSGTVSNCAISGNSRDGVNVYYGTATESNCAVSGNGGSGIYVNSGTARVSNCAISGNSGSGVYLDYGTATVSNCTISGNVTGVYVYPGTATVSNCTISGNAHQGVYVGSSDTTVTNSIVAFNGTGIRRGSTSYTLTLSYNDVYGNTTANYSNITDPTGTNGNVSVDPLLSNPYRDIHIQPGSPCRDAGNDALVQEGWTDIDGQARIQGDHVDIGSDESDGTTWTVPVTTRFVKPTGDDGNDGLSWATAKKSITSVLAVSQGLDEVWVSAGTYTENVSIPLGVALYGGFVGTETERNRRNWATNVTTIVSPSTSSDVVTSRSVGVTLDGFTIRNGRYGVYVYYGTATVINCVVSGNSSYGVYVNYGTATVSTCVVSGNSSNGVYVSSGTATVSNCAISGNVTGVNVNSGTATVSNCTISGNNSYGVYVYSGGTTVTNSIVAFNGTGIYRSSSYTLTLACNDVFGNTTANYDGITDPTGTNGNISVDPLLSNPYRDFHIQPGSPCRDAGNDALVQEGWTDIDGQARIQGAHVDIGSDESDGTTWTVPVTTRFVKPTGDDGNDGLSWATAKKSITSALAVSQGLDEVWVVAGVYTENVSIPLGVALYGGFVGTETERNQRNWTANVTAIASPSSSSDVVTSRSVGVTLDGFTIRNGRYGVYVNYGSATVSNCAVSGNSTHGVFVYYGAATVTNCITSGNNRDGFYVGWSGTATVTNCAISGNSRYGVAVGSSGTATASNCAISGNGSSGVYVDSSGTATASNCAISGNGSSGVYVDSRGTATVSNSIVAFNGTGIYRSSTSYTLTLSYNDVYGNTTANYDGVTDPTGTGGNISLDPLFVDRAAGNLHLLPGSPCIDVGDDSVVTAGQTDLDGNPRIQGAHVDMGAYEYPAGTGYRWWNVVRALAIAGGAIQATAADIAFLNKDSSDGVITIRDAARIARKAAGLDANP